MATCRICSCTDEDCSKCIEKTGHPCSWVEPDLCSACVVPPTIDSIARDLAVRHQLAAALVIVLDGGGAMHIGCAAVNDPITVGFQAFARSVDIACERGVPGFNGISRERAIEIARRCAKARPQSYYAEPFEPHEWVVDAVLEAGATLPALPPSCFHCGAVVDKEATREHIMTCAKSPLVQELQRLRVIVEQAEVVARHWEAQDGVNGAELDKLCEVVFDRPDARPTTVDKLRAEVAMLRAELAEHYPVAITARAMMNDEAKLEDLREVSDRIGNSTLAARLEYLPQRLRGGS